MRLELGTFHVSEAAFGSTTRLEHGRLEIDRAGLRATLIEDHDLADVEIELALPGEATRLVHVLDVVEPRVKVEGPGCIFPGFLGPPETVGQGRTHRLAGVAVVETGQFPEQRSAFWEGVIDMAGPAQAYSPFGRTINVVLNVQARAGLGLEARDAAIRRAGLRTAAVLAEASRDGTPDELAVFELPKPSERLPRLAYLCQVKALGPLENTFLYGLSMGRSLPALLHPNELFDGAIVSGNFFLACQRNSTYLHLNNPVARELCRRHGRDLDFAGVIVLNGDYDFWPDKERSSKQAAKLAKLLGADGAIVSGEGGGHVSAHLMMTCQECERLGIPTTVLTNEIGDAAGQDTSLVNLVPEARAVVHNGNGGEPVEMPRVDRVLGGDYVLDADQPAGGPLTVLLHCLCAATNQMGYGRLTARQY